MPDDSKRTKRVRDASETLSLEEHIANQRCKLVAERREVPSLRARAQELRRRADGMRARWQVRPATDLRCEADALDREADERESMVREHRFESLVVSYLRVYHKQNSSGEEATKKARKSDSIAAYMRQTDANVVWHGTILDEYLTEMNSAPPKVAMAARDECPRCDVKLLLNTSRSVLTCPRCGHTASYLDITSSSTSFDEVVEFSQYSYKRVNHYCMWLALVQGKEAHRVPDDVLEAVMADLHDRQKVVDVAEVTPRRVRDALRKLRLRKAYDHVVQITARISGVRPPRISADVEEKLRNMFLQMQPAFQRHAPKSRTNFLSYPYVVYRCFQILGLNHMLDGITLLKGRDKLEANDAIFRRMSQDLGWPVFDLPSDTGGG